jgi:hypothetical protein
MAQIVVTAPMNGPDKKIGSDVIFFFSWFFSRMGGLLNSYSRSAYAENSYAVYIYMYTYDETCQGLVPQVLRVTGYGPKF